MAKFVYCVIGADASQGIEVGASVRVFSTWQKARDFELAEAMSDFSPTGEAKDYDPDECSPEQAQYIKDLKKWRGTDTVELVESDIEVAGIRRVEERLLDSTE